MTFAEAIQEVIHLIGKSLAIASRSKVIDCVQITLRCLVTLHA